MVVRMCNRPGGLASFRALPSCSLVLGLNLLGDWLRDYLDPTREKMTTILNLDVPRTRDALVSLLLSSPPSQPVEAWLFDDGPSTQGSGRKARRRRHKGSASAAPTSRWSISSWKRLMFPPHPDRSRLSGSCRGRSLSFPDRSLSAGRTRRRCRNILPPQRSRSRL